jgi:methyl-accepting chemotaxis protein
MSIMNNDIIASQTAVGDWRKPLHLFDPEGRLNDLLDGLNAVFEDRYDAIYESQLRIARLDPKLAVFLSDEQVEQGRVESRNQFKARFSAPLSDAFAEYTQRFGKMMVQIGASPNTAMALISCTYGELMKVARERLSGDERMDAMRAIRLLTSVESNIMVSAMHEEMRALHADQLRRQAEAFEANVLASVSALSERSDQLRQSSSHAGEVSRNLREASCAVASAAEQSAMAMQEAKRSVGYLSDTVNKVQFSVASTDRAAQDASHKAAESAASAKQLSDSSAQIEAIVKLIRSIAEQTQILALNATIEAARAGESGAGFAVVANEVKQMANQTRDATSQIGTQVDEIVAATRESANVAVEISDQMNLIGAGTEGIRTEIESQISTIQAIMDAIAETFISADHVTENVTAINVVAEEVMQRFVTVEEDFSIVDSLLNRLANDVREYRLTFDQLIAEQGSS